MDVGPPLVADAQPTKCVEPGEAALDNPAVSAQAILGFDAPTGNTRDNAALSEVVTAEGEIVSLVGVQFGWSTARAPALPGNGRRLGQEGNEVLAVVVIGP